MGQGEAGWERFLAPAIGLALCIGAGVLIASFLGDSHPEETIGKLGYVVLTLTIFGPCAATGLFLVARRPRWAPFGYLTTAIALLGFAAVAVRILEGTSLFLGDDFELQGIGLFLALTTAQASLALAYARADDPLLLRLVTLGSILIILGLGVLGALEIVVDDVRPSDQLFGVLFTLYLLGTALLILFRLAAWSRRRLPAGDAPTP